MHIPCVIIGSHMIWMDHFFSNIQCGQFIVIIVVYYFKTNIIFSFSTIIRLLFEVIDYSIKVL